MAAVPQPAPPPPAKADDDPLLGCLHVITRLQGRPVSLTALQAGLPLDHGRCDAAAFVRAARAHGYSARLVRRPLARISNLLLPVTLLLADGGACVLTRRLAGGRAEVVVPESGFGAREVGLDELARDYAGYALFAQPELRPEEHRLDEPAVRRRKAWFWGTLGGYLPYYVEAGLAGLLVNVLAVATSLFVMNVYDRVVPNNATETLVVLATGTTIAIAFEFVARTLRAYFLDVAGKKADLALGGQIFAQALGMQLAARPASAGAFASQLREFEAVRDFITSVTLTAVMDLPFVAFFLFVVALIGGPLYLAPLLAVPVILVVGLLAQIPLALATRANLQEGAMRHGLLVESLEGLEMLKAMRAEGQLQGRYEDYTALTGRSANRARLISSTVVNFTGVVQQVVTVAVVCWGVHLIAAGELTVGALIACVMLTGRALAPLQQVAALMMRYQHARAAHATLDRIMRQPVERPPGAQFTERAEVRGDIALVDVHFTYPGAGVPTLNGVNLSIAAGERVAILGRVGSGKSTLLKLLPALYAPTRGSVRVDGIDVAQFDPADLRRRIGYVAQDAMLFHGSLRDNIALGLPHADDAQVLRAARLAGLESLIDGHPSGLQLIIGERGQGLSGGQRQAVSIARALLLEPPILLLDEPSSAMDHNSEARFIRDLGDFVRDRTLVLVTHKPVMLNLVTRIIVIEAGKVALDGPRDDILRQLARPAAAAGQGS